MSDLYLFQLIVLLSPVFNCCKSLLSFSADKVTSGTHNFVSVFLKFAFVGELSQTAAATILLFMSVITQSADQLKAKDTSRLINGIFKLFQKFLRCFNGTTISVCFVPHLFASYAGLSILLPSALVICSETL